jgi:hypothetical protein
MALAIPRFRQREHDDVQTAVGDGQHIIDLQRSGHPLRRLDRPVVGTEDIAHQLLQQQAHAEGGQQGFQRPPVEESHDAAFDQHAEDSRDDEGRGYGHEDRCADVVRHQLLHHVNGVRAQHHQLAVRHVDHAHDAEGHRQANAGQHQHRAQAEAEKQCLDAGIKAAPVPHVGDGRRGRATYLGIRIGLTDILAHAGHRAEPREDLVVHAGSKASDSGDAQLRIGIAEVGDGQRVGHGIADRGVLLRRGVLAQQCSGVIVQVVGQLLHRGEAQRGVHARQLPLRDRATQRLAQSVVRANAVEFRSRRLAQRLAGFRIGDDQRIAVADGYDDLLVREPVEETAIEHGRQYFQGSRAALAHQRRDQIALRGEVGIRQLRQHRLQ